MNKQYDEDDRGSPHVSVLFFKLVNMLDHQINSKVLDEEIEKHVFMVSGFCKDGEIDAARELLSDEVLNG